MHRFIERVRGVSEALFVAGDLVDRSVVAPRSNGYWVETFAWSGSVAPRLLARGLAFGLISAVLCAIPGWNLAIPVGPHEIAGVVLGLLLVLRSNAGYERWWEARKLWGGIVNQSRNLAIQALAYGPADPRWRSEVVRWTIAFAHGSRRSLRGERIVPEVQTLLGDQAAARVVQSAHIPATISRSIGRLLGEAHAAGELTGFAFQRLERERAALMDHLGGCERIRKTPLARVYSIEIRRFVSTFLVTLTFAMLHEFGDSRWMVPPLVMLVSYALLAIDQIGLEIQNPFAVGNLGHLPLDAICQTIEADLLGLLDEEPDRPVAKTPRPASVLEESHRFR